MEKVMFQYEVGTQTLCEELSIRDFEWPSNAKCCFQLTDGEVVFVKLTADSFNKLRFDSRLSDTSSILSLISSENFIYSEHLLLLDVIAIDWNVAVNRSQIFQTLLKTLGEHSLHEVALDMAIKKANQLKLLYQNTNKGMLINLDMSNTVFIPTEPNNNQFVYSKKTLGFSANE